jgi:hypothetical protein
VRNCAVTSAISLYPLYCVHFPILMLVDSAGFYFFRHDHWIVEVISGCAPTIVTAWALAKYFDAPVRRRLMMASVTDRDGGLGIASSPLSTVPSLETLKSARASSVQGTLKNSSRQELESVQARSSLFHHYVTASVPAHSLQLSHALQSAMWSPDPQRECAPDGRCHLHGGKSPGGAGAPQAEIAAKIRGCSSGRNRVHFRRKQVHILDAVNCVQPIPLRAASSKNCLPSEGGLPTDSACSDQRRSKCGSSSSGGRSHNASRGDSRRSLRDPCRTRDERWQHHLR